MCLKRQCWRYSEVYVEIQLQIKHKLSEAQHFQCFMYAGCFQLHISEHRFLSRHVLAIFSNPTVLAVTFLNLLMLV